MLQAILDFFTWVSDIVSSLLTFLESIINGLVSMLLLFPKIVSVTTSAIGYVPTIFAIFISLGITVYIVYLIIGRNAGGSGG